MSDDRRLIEDFLPIEAISSDLPAAMRSSASRGVESKTE
jgi:hypothetical protein